MTNQREDRRPNLEPRKDLDSEHRTDGEALLGYGLDLKMAYP